MKSLDIPGNTVLNLPGNTRAIVTIIPEDPEGMGITLVDIQGRVLTFRVILGEGFVLDEGKARYIEEVEPQLANPLAMGKPEN